MKNYFQVMLGRKSMYAEQAVAGGYVGADFDIHLDLTGKLPDDWREFVPPDIASLIIQRFPGYTRAFGYQ